MLYWARNGRHRVFLVLISTRVPRGPVALATNDTFAASGLASGAVSANDNAELLRRHNLRVTPQRRAILQAFRDAADEHLSADEVISRASVAVPEIGRGTVYATLAEFAELGVLGSVGNPEPIRYETNVAPHDHFRCRLCLRLFDVDLGGSSTQRRLLDGYTIESVAVQAEGVCADCHAYVQGLSDGAAEITGTALMTADMFDALACSRIQSPVGELGAVASAAGIVHVAFADHADFGNLSERARSRRGPAAARRRLSACSETLERYFAGRQAPAPDAIDWRLLSDAKSRTLTAVQQIPYAQPSSYNRLASELNAYAIGRLMGANPVPLLVPCHRVSCGSDRPDVYVGGLANLHTLHALEGG
jgi:Fe2+ or Zn2+ uptake regulation protein/O6-methylguanine-DNA--protein-cysteine methyltransferase